MHCRQLLQSSESRSRKDGATDEQGALQQKEKDEEEEHAQGGGFEERVQEKAEYAVSCPGSVSVLHASMPPQLVALGSCTVIGTEIPCPARLGTAGLSTLESTRWPSSQSHSLPTTPGPANCDGEVMRADRTKRASWLGRGREPGCTGKRHSWRASRTQQHHEAIASSSPIGHATQGPLRWFLA